MLDNGNKVSFEELFSDKPLGPPSVNVVLAEDGMTLKFFQSFCPWGPNALELRFGLRIEQLLSQRAQYPSIKTCTLHRNINIPSILISRP